MTSTYEIPEIQGDTGLQKAISFMLRQYMQTCTDSMPSDPAIAPGLVALRFAWWLFDHPEELEAAAVEMEGEQVK